MPGPKRKPIADRLWSRVNILGPDDCWLWTGATNGVYGRISPGPRDAVRIGTHVAAWLDTYGFIPKGMAVLHNCDTPLCCNPRHLFIGTTEDNNRDAGRKGRAHWTRTVRDETGRFTNSTKE